MRIANGIINKNRPTKTGQKMQIARASASELAVFECFIISDEIKTPTTK